MVSATAEEAYEGLGPWTGPDEGQGYPLLHLVEAVTARMHELNELVSDREELGWSSVVDADRATQAQLPWLAQFLGVDVPVGLSVEIQRQALKATAGFRRGTKLAIAGAAQKHLTGQKTVQITERDNSAYHFTVRTFLVETPDRDLVEAELLKAKPAGLLMTYEVFSGQTYGELAATGDTYAQLSGEYPTYFDLTTSLPPAI